MDLSKITYSSNSTWFESSHKYVRNYIPVKVLFIKMLNVKPFVDGYQANSELCSYGYISSLYMRAVKSTQ